MDYSLKGLPWAGMGVTLLSVILIARPACLAAADGASEPGQTSIKGSEAAAAGSFNGVLTFRNAIERGLTYNLMTMRLTEALDQARGEQRIARSALLPTVTGDFNAAERRVNLTVLGLQFDPIPGFTVPEVSGPFGVVDLRANLVQTIVDVRALNTHRAALEAVRAAELSLADARDLIVQIVGAAYLEAVATRAKVEAAGAQLDTATAIERRTVQQQGAGLATPIDVNRARVQTLVERQHLVVLQADLAKRKIDLARAIGLPPTDRYELADSLTFSPGPTLAADQAVERAVARRADLRAAEAQVRAAERGLAAARAEQLPSATVTADYGASRAGGSQTFSTYSVVGLVKVPIWQGGRTAGTIERAAAILRQRRAELDDVRAQVEGDVRKAFVDLQAAASRVDAAQAGLEVSRENLDLTQKRFAAGVSDNIAVVQSQQSVALAEADHINSVFAHNSAKLSLARAVGDASEALAEYLPVP
jgi:outer membrane protein TolC